MQKKDWFGLLAQSYQLSGRSYSDLCEYNCHVRDSFFPPCFLPKTSTALQVLKLFSLGIIIIIITILWPSPNTQSDAISAKLFFLLVTYFYMVLFFLMTYCWFSHDVTKIQTKKLSILPRFYFHDILEQLKTNFHTNFCFKRVLGFVIEYA